MRNEDSPDSLAIRDAYDSEYYLADCGGHETYRASGGKALDLRLDCMARLARLVPKTGRRVLDLGCGRGEMARYLASLGNDVDAVDYSPTAISLAERCFEGEPALRARVRLVCASVTDPDCYAGQYDLVLASDLIEHLSARELDTLYALVAAHLAPDGVFVIHTFPNAWYYRFGHPRRRRAAAARGVVLPENPRSAYEMQMHINEQSPNRMRRQLRGHFEEVLLWAGDHQAPGGSLARPFARADWFSAPSLFAVVGHQPTAPEEVLACLEKSVDVAEPAPPAPSLKHRLAQLPWVGPLLRWGHSLLVLPRFRQSTTAQLAQLAARLDAMEGGGVPADWYQDFENQFRGSPEAIRERMTVYLPDMEALGASRGQPVLDLGCGRGDWLALLAERSIPALGVDSNPAALAQATARGLDVTEGDALMALNARPAGSLSAVTAFHLVEHLPFEQMLHLINAAFRALAPGGLLLLETPNPENRRVGACSFYTDPTHRKPIVPDVLAFALGRAGFVDIKIRRLHPLVPEEQSGLVDADGAALSALVNGPRDFAALGRRPG